MDFRFLPAMAVLLPAMALADLRAIDPIHEVLPYNHEALRICVGTAGLAYDQIGLLLSGPLTQRSQRPVEVVNIGGTVACARAIAAGDAAIMIGQHELKIWLKATNSPLDTSILGSAGGVLTEPVLGFCSRDEGESELNDIIQSWGSNSLAIAGGVDSGTNLFMNMLALEDGGISSQDWVYSSSLADAMQMTKEGDAVCAVGIVDIDAPQLGDLDDDFGAALRLVEFWDGDARDVKLGGGGQAFRWMAIEEDNQNVNDFLEWKAGKGNSKWKPEVVTTQANVFFRKDVLTETEQNVLKTTVPAISRVRKTHE